MPCWQPRAGRTIDPHAASSPDEHARWEHDLANFNQDVSSLQEFFLDVIDQRLVGKDKIDEKAYTFFGVQGPWYTVGYKMSVVVEKRYGRKRLIECMLDPTGVVGELQPGGYRDKRQRQGEAWRSGRLN